MQLMGDISATAFLYELHRVVVHVLQKLYLKTTVCSFVSSKYRTHKHTLKNKCVNITRFFCPLNNTGYITHQRVI